MRLISANAHKPWSPIERLYLQDGNNGLVNIQYRVLDPGRDRRMQQHLGSHPVTILRLGSNRAFQENALAAVVYALRHNVSTLICCCKSSKHYRDYAH